MSIFVKYQSVIYHNSELHLLKICCKVWPKFDRKIPPNLQFGEHKSFSPDMDGNEWLQK